MTPMRLRALALLLFAYVSVEFANPLMPGAVSLDGTMEAVRAERADPPPGPPMITWRLHEPLVVQREVPRQPALVEPARHGPAVIRRAPPAPPPPAPSEDD
jgi:hypothetical protein